MVFQLWARSSEDQQWLDGLLTHKFFQPCEIHPDEKKNEKNIYCMSCCESMCPHCSPGHAGHRLLQIRRYVYHDVVRLQDVNRLLDFSLVQPYIVNSARVVFLNDRPQPGPSKGGNCCLRCDRILQSEYKFCSLGCKVGVLGTHSVCHRLPESNAVQDDVTTGQDSCHRNCSREGTTEMVPSPMSPQSSASNGQVVSCHNHRDGTEGFKGEEDDGSSPESPFFVTKKPRSPRWPTSSDSPKTPVLELPGFDEAATTSPKSVFEITSFGEASPCSLPVASTRSTKKRKSPPQRAPAF